MKKKDENFLERKPYRQDHLTWSKDQDGMVVLEIENTGFFNRIAQRCLNKPKTSFVHLDALGSFIWTRLDREKTIVDLGKELEMKFGKEAQPLYERLAKYLQILHSYGFVQWN